MTKATAGNDLWVLPASTIDIAFAITQTGTISLGANGELADELTHPAPRTGAGAYPKAPPCQSADLALSGSVAERLTCRLIWLGPGDFPIFTPLVLATLGPLQGQP
jgi:hypothetical protein